MRRSVATRNSFHRFSALHETFLRIISIRVIPPPTIPLYLIIHEFISQNIVSNNPKNVDHSGRLREFATHRPISGNGLFGFVTRQCLSSSFTVESNLNAKSSSTLHFPRSRSLTSSLPLNDDEFINKLDALRCFSLVTASFKC